MRIDIPYHLLCYLRPPLPPCSLGQMQAFLIISPCMVRHLELQKLRTVQKQVLAVFVPWLNEWAKRAFIRAADGLRKLCWTYEESNENLLQLQLWHRPASSKVSSLPQLRTANFYLNKSFYLNNKLLSRKISLEELERTKSTVSHSILCLQQPFRCDHHPSQFTNWEAERSAAFPTPLWYFFNHPSGMAVCFQASLSAFWSLKDTTWADLQWLCWTPVVCPSSASLWICSAAFQEFSSVSLTQLLPKEIKANYNTSIKYTVYYSCSNCWASSRAERPVLWYQNTGNGSEVLVMILGKSFVQLRCILYIQNGPMEFVTVLL